MIGNYLIEETERLEREAEVCYQKLVLPNWGRELHGFPDILYGFMMGIMARVDLVSVYYFGSSGSQTERMVNFLTEFVSGNIEANKVLVFMWRHKLVHTASPRNIRDKNTRIIYRWLLHWGEHLPLDQHYTINESSQGEKILQIGMLYLIKDLKKGIQKYLQLLNNTALLRQQYEEIDFTLNNSEKELI